MLKFGVGQPLRRFEDRRLLTGQGRFQDDVILPRQAHAVFVRSPHAHAEIGAVDTAAARTMPGVLAVYTGTDYRNDGLAMPKATMPRKKADGSPMFAPQRPALVVDRVRYVGDPIAMVIAESLDRRGMPRNASRSITGRCRRQPRSPRRRGRGRRGSGTRTRTTSRTATSVATARRPRRPSRMPLGSSRGAMSSAASMPSTWSRGGRSAPMTPPKTATRSTPTSIIRTGCGTCWPTWCSGCRRARSA